LTDATRAVSAMTSLRSMLTDREERTALTRGAIDLSKDALEAAERVRKGDFYEDESKKIPTRSQFIYARKAAELKEEAAKGPK
jgi:hypothetical protein